MALTLISCVRLSVRLAPGQPSVIVAHMIKGKELFHLWKAQVGWHGTKLMSSLPKLNLRKEAGNHGEVKKIATRDAYGKALVELGRDHGDLLVFDADLAKKLRVR